MNILHSRDSRRGNAPKLGRRRYRFGINSAAISHENQQPGPRTLDSFATLTATAGTGISIVAFPWLALQHRDSARDAAIVATAMTLPLVVSTLVAGTAVDFFGRRRISLVSDSLSGAAVAAVPLIAAVFGPDTISLVVLAVLAALAAAFDPAGTTAR